MKYFMTLIFAILILSGCGDSNNTASTESTLQPQVKDAELRPPAPPSM